MITLEIKRFSKKSQMGFDIDTEMFVVGTDGFPATMIHEEHINSLVNARQLSRLNEGDTLRFKLVEVEDED
jgi:hypothetical protein